jgi:hypothetical protein
MTDAVSDPRAQFRQLPEPVRPEDLVETLEADRPVVVETPLQEAWRVALLGGGTP